MKKPDQIKKRKESENQKVYDYLESEILDIRHALKNMYAGEKAGLEGYIHGLIEKIDRIDRLMFGLLIDKEPIKDLLERAYQKSVWYYENSHT